MIGKFKIVTFVIKFGSQGSINVMFEVKVKVGSRFRRICCIFDYESLGYIRCKTLLNFLLFNDKTSSI